MSAIRPSSLLIALTFTVLTAAVQAQISGSDNFNDNLRDAAKWNTDIIIGNGALLETNQRLEYRVTSPDLVNGDEAERAWILNFPGYTNDWEVVLEVTNAIAPTIVGQVASIGLEVINAGDLADYAYVEMYASALGNLPYRRGFKASVAVNDVDLNDGTTGRADVGVGIAQTSGAVRLVFNGGSKVLSAFADLDGAANGLQWTKLGSFGLAGAGGSITNGNWNMTPASFFYVAIYGFSEGLTITSGQIHGDNFLAQTSPGTSPAITADVIANSLRLRWPQSAVAYELESRANLATGTWSAVTNPPTTLNATNTLLLPTDAPMKFFRLRR